MQMFTNSLLFSFTSGKKVQLYVWCYTIDPMIIPIVKDRELLGINFAIRSQINSNTVFTENKIFMICGIWYSFGKFHVVSHSDNNVLDLIQRGTFSIGS